MARYGDLDALLENLKKQYGEELGWQCTVNMSDVGMMIEDAPTADVVPRSEVEDLQKKLEEKEVELMNVCLDKTNCDEMIQYILDFHFKQKVKEVFAEIEFEIHQLDFDRDETRAIAIEGIIANAKKKYTEGKSNED
jgi:hypothetical protein